MVVSDPVRQRILDAGALLKGDGAVGGWAAAYLHGVSYLDGRGEDVRLVIPRQRQIRRTGITTTRAELDPGEVVSRHGVTCTNGTRTAFDMLRLAFDLTEAVTAGDCLLRAGLTDEGTLLRYAVEHPRSRGLQQLRAALPLLDPAAASPPESRLRMLCHQSTDLPRLLVNVPVYDAAGEFLGIPDLLEPVTGLVIEYDGAQHRDLEQHTADNLREEGFEGAGLAVVRVTSLDLKEPDATSSRIIGAYGRRLTRDGAGDGWSVGWRPKRVA